MPFGKFPGVDPILGPEMKSTGEVMGVGDSFPEAFLKATIAAGSVLPERGTAFISVRDVDKPGTAEVGRELVELGFDLVATRGTAKILKEAGLQVRQVKKVQEGRPHIVDMIKNDEIDFIVNTTEGRRAIADSASIRSSAEQHRVFYTTTLAAAQALCLAKTHKTEPQVRRLQDLHERVRT
jgi:carbamoyl-phosphate synthase large subunit